MQRIKMRRRYLHASRLRSRLLAPASLAGQTTASRRQLPERTAGSADGDRAARLQRQCPAGNAVRSACFDAERGCRRTPASHAGGSRADGHQEQSQSQRRRLLALAQHQVVRETRSAELPTANASITAVQAEDASRISAGSLTASRLFEHAGAGGGFTQLITDFGKTSNLVASSKLQEKAQNANALATTEDIVLATDQAFYNALQAQALLKVANRIRPRGKPRRPRSVRMTKNKLKSTLDLSFADVNLSQAKLLQLDAQNNADSTMAALDAVLGLDQQVTYDLVEDSSPLTATSADADQLMQLALQQRPDLQALNYDQQAAVKFSHARARPDVAEHHCCGNRGERADPARAILRLRTGGAESAST